MYIQPCGCVFSAGGLRAVSSDKGKVKATGDEPSEGEKGEEMELCPQCGTKYAPGTDVLTLNPSEAEAERMHAAMLVRRAVEPMKSKGKKRKAGTDAAAETAPADKKAKKAAPAPSTNPSIAAASRAVVAGLALEDAKRKVGMSDAVKSLYADKDAPKRKETFMTMGTFTRVRLQPCSL